MHAKLMLFGEYTVLVGSKALAIPFDKYSASWEQLKVNPHKDKLMAFADYLEARVEEGKLPLRLNVSAFRDDVRNGFGLMSDIPIGYGLGSSGALCATVLKQYLNVRGLLKMEDLKQHLTEMELFFHSSSSGLDPLVIYLNRAILFKPQGGIETVEVPVSEKGRGAVFIIDTNMARETRPLVDWFMAKNKESRFQEAYTERMINYNNTVINDFLSQKNDEVMKKVNHMSELQLNYMTRMVPERLLQVWEEGLFKGEFALKLCGAGGGGLFWGFTQNWENAKAILARYNPQLVFHLDL